MNCNSFRRALASDDLSAEALAHMRSCTACLEAAVAIDPDFIFRSLGTPVDPPGGVDAFVGDVMQQVHLRQTEKSLERRRYFTPGYRWAAAAALAIAVSSVLLTTRSDQAPVTTATRQQAAVSAVPASLPVIESYEESGAMIVELPAQESDDLKVVMIFDETLPVDL